MYSYYIASGLIAIAIAVAIKKIWQRNSPINKLRETLMYIVTTFQLNEICDDITMTHVKNSEKLYDTYKCEIVMSYDGRTYHGYFDFVYSNTNRLEVSGRTRYHESIDDNCIHVIGNHREAHTIESSDLCMLLFFERHIPEKASSIRRYRNKRYKWNVGRLAYLPMELANTTQPN